VALNDYHVTTTWHVDAGVDEVAAVLDEPAALSRWWPAAFLGVTVVTRPHGLRGARGWVWSKGWLPYTLRFQYDATELPDRPGVFIRVTGDFEGRCVCSVTPRGARVAIEFDWRVRARKPMVRRLSWLLRPVFIANHRWVMARGLESLRLELSRRRAEAGLGGTSLPPPPGPTFPYGSRYRRLRLAGARVASAWLPGRGSPGLGREAGG
jgi:hypothetical protein